MPAGNASIALMYHGIVDGNDRRPLTQYSITAVTFRRHLEQVKSRGGSGCSARDWLASGVRRPSAIITLDDGLVSDYDTAFPILCEFGMRADFFVNPTTVGTAGHVSWAMLREMSNAGMSVQSHGYTHDYLTTLSPADLHDSLRRSREVIEERIGAPVGLIAPPGGRMPRGLAKAAQVAGFTHVLCSRPGYVLPHAAGRYIPRMAVTSSTSEAEFSSWIDRKWSPLVRMRLRYGALGAAKRILGDARYEQLRRLALSAKA